ncbi:MAG TPA: tetratricopeptide repeat protein [Pseudonocardiaceae bacterium]|nr:tetratricopeptide repeat protein [Pseudonocardiaceae bacterium]
MKIPPKTVQANHYVERFVRTVRSERTTNTELQRTPRSRSSPRVWPALNDYRPHQGREHHPPNHTGRHHPAQQIDPPPPDLRLIDALRRAFSGLVVCWRRGVGWAPAVGGHTDAVSPDWLPDVTDIVKTGVAGIQAAAAWRRPATTDNAPDDGSDYAVPGTSTAVPCEAGPIVVHGREQDTTRLLAALDKRNPQGPQLLVGAGGMGKSTIAGQVAARARETDRQRQIWWITATNEERLSSGLISVAQQLGASTADQEILRTHTVAELGDIADRFWDRLESTRPGWLLVINNADDPSLLGPPDGTGWIRPTHHGLLLVTTRDGAQSHWPGCAELVKITELTTEDAIRVLMDLAPDAGGRQAAQALAIRLGRLPLALRMAGMYLRRDFRLWPTFDEYRQALEQHGVARVDGSPAHREAIQTWELSLDALATADCPQARPLLWLLACYAPGNRIPQEILTASDLPETSRHPLATLLAPAAELTTHELAEHCLAGVDGLASVGLIQGPTTPSERGTMELHPFIAEATRSVLDATDSATTTIDPSLVRSGAVAAISARTEILDVSRAEHWQYFHVLTPHVQQLLAGAGPHLRPQERQVLLDCMTRCITSYLWSRAEQRAEQLARSALELGRQLACVDSPAFLRLQLTQAWSIREQDRYAESETLFRELLRRQLALLPDGPIHTDTLRTRHHLAWAVGRQGRWADAEAEFRDVLRLRRDICQRQGENIDDIDILHTRCMLCWCVGNQGRWEEAEHGYRLLVANRETILGATHPDTLDTGESLGKVLAWQGKWVEAEINFQELATARCSALGETHPDTLLARQLAAYAAGHRAQLHHNRQGVRDAIRTLIQVLDQQRSIRGEAHRNTRDTHALIAALRRTDTPVPPWPTDLPRP